MSIAHAQQVQRLAKLEVMKVTPRGFELEPGESYELLITPCMCAKGKTIAHITVVVVIINTKKSPDLEI